MSNNYIYILDTTLRDGEQSPGATLSIDKKIKIAKALNQLGVDIIEAGFPASSDEELEAVRQIALEVGNTPGPSGEAPVICGIARATHADINKAWEAVRLAQRPRIHTFLATSPIHMKYKLRMNPQQVIEKVQEIVSFAKRYCNDIQFSTEDAGRSDPEFLYLVTREAIRCGATTLNVPDTVGYMTPSEYGGLISGIIQNVSEIDSVTLSVHCHDDLGLATANTLAGLQAGARQAEVTINGIGERAGNAALEEIVMILHTRFSTFSLETGIVKSDIMSISEMTSNYTNIPIQPNKAIVGANAFAHESGIHQDGMLKNPDTYEVIKPELVGQQSSLVLGKHSGRHAFRAHLFDMGYLLEEDELEKLFARFKELASTKKVIDNNDINLLLASSQN